MKQESSRELTRSDDYGNFLTADKILLRHMSKGSIGSLLDLSCQASVDNRSKREVEARLQDSSSRRQEAVPNVHIDGLRYRWQIALWLSTPGMMGLGISDRCAAGNAAASRTLDMDSCQTPGNTQRLACCK